LKAQSVGEIGVILGQKGDGMRRVVSWQFPPQLRLGPIARRPEFVNAAKLLSLAQFQPEGLLTSR